jgi:hypothetical protein
VISFGELKVKQTHNSQRGRKREEQNREKQVQNTREIIKGSGKQKEGGGTR